MVKNTAFPERPFQLKAIALTVIMVVFITGAIYLLGGTNPLAEPHNQIQWRFLKPATAVGMIKDSQTNPFVATTLLMAFSLMLFLPFWPGLRESLWPRDKYPLAIEMKYSKDPRHLSKSFRNLLLQSLRPDTTSQNIRTVHMSKKEVVEIKETCRVPTGETVAHTLMVQKDMFTEQQVIINQDLYVIGSAHIGEKNQIRTLACDGDIEMAPHSQVMRWMDAEGKINIGSGCNLGASCSAVNRLTLGKDVTFRRLFGNPVVTPGYVERAQLKRAPAPAHMAVPAAKIKTIEDTTYYRRKSSLLQSGTSIHQNVIVKGDLVLADHVTINGNVRCEGYVTIGKNSIIHGNLFCEGAVDVYEGAAVTGSIFSQDAIHLFANTSVGKPGSVKSTIAKKKITLGRNVAIYGYALTEGKGLVS